MTTGIKLFGLAILSGVLLFLAAPGLIGFGPCAWVALIPLIFVCSQTRPGKAAALGLICGLVHYTLLLYWIMIVLGTYAYLSWYVSVPALLLLAFYMALYSALFAALLSFTLPVFPAIITAPFLWVALDYVRGFLFTGFPWQDLGYSQYQFPILIQAADLFGHHGVTFLIVLANAFIFSLLLFCRSKTGTHPQILRTPPKYLACAAMIILAMFGYSILRYQALSRDLTAAPTAAIGIVQGNIPQDVKWEPSFQTGTIDTYINLSETLLAQNQVELLVWPETALPFYPKENQLFQQLIDRLVTKHRVPLLTGAPHREHQAPTTQYFNSGFLIAPDGATIARYDKQHLVPFGEYIPLRLLMPSSIVPIVETMGDFTQGASTQPITIGELRLGVLICYESIFPDIARQETTAGANLLVNLTNDAWYGRSSAPWQQLSMAVFRAVETKRSLARAANTGISVFIDPLGRTLKISPLFTDFQAADNLPLLTETTFFCRIGHLFPLACLLGFTALVALARQKRMTIQRW